MGDADLAVAILCRLVKDLKKPDLYAEELIGVSEFLESERFQTICDIGHLDAGWVRQKIYQEFIRRKTMRERIEERQQRILQFLKDFITREGYSPSFREIAEGCNISGTSVVQFDLDALEKRGLVKRKRGHTRTVRLT